MNISTISDDVRDLYGYIFDDHVCISAYGVDIHPMTHCAYPSHMHQYYPILSFL